MKQTITACAFIHQGQKVFIAQRASDSSFLPNAWELPGGHIETDEDMISGLKREIREEFGREISAGDPFFVFTYLNPKKNAQYIEVVYFAKFLDDKDPVLNPREHREWAWISEKELIKHFSQKDPEYEAALKGFAFLKNPRPNFG